MSMKPESGKNETSFFLYTELAVLVLKFVHLVVPCSVVFFRGVKRMMLTDTTIGSGLLCS